MGPFVSTPGTDGPKLLRTRPGRVIGPGHASVVHAPDNVHEYIVYHAWDPRHTKRLMRIDRLDWRVEGPTSPAPTLDPQLAPPLPWFGYRCDGPDEAPPTPDAWRVDRGDWRKLDGELIQRDSGARPATALLASVPPIEEFLLEVNVRLVEPSRDHGRYGLFLNHGGGDRISLMLAADGSGLLCDRDTQGSSRRTNLGALGPGFRSEAYHRLLVSARAGKLEVRVDGVHVASEIEVPAREAGVGLLTYAAAAAFAGISVTLLPEM
jgi:hypothetical protein